MAARQCSPLAAGHRRGGLLARISDCRRTAAADAAVGLVFVGMLGAGAESVRIRQHGIDLPLLARRAGHPDLVLGGEATGGAHLLIGEQALAGEPGDLRVHVSLDSTSTPRWLMVPPFPGFCSSTNL